MELRKAFLWAVLGTAAVLGALPSAGADEPLAVKVEMRHGRNGPRKAIEAAPGELIFLAMTVSGLTLNSSGKYKLSCDVEFRDPSDELVDAKSGAENEFEPFLATDPLAFMGFFKVPEDYAGENVKQVFVVRDLVSGKELKNECVIVIRRPTSPFPFEVTYWLNDRDPLPASGKFTTNDTIRIEFNVGGIKGSKAVKWKAEFIPKGSNEPIRQLSFDRELPLEYKKENILPTYFSLRPANPFDGKIRITVTDEESRTNSIEAPLLVTEPLSLDSPAYLAEHPEAETKSTKKE